jgi:hypothetical protein
MGREREGFSEITGKNRSSPQEKILPIVKVCNNYKYLK